MPNTPPIDYNNQNIQTNPQINANINTDYNSLQGQNNLNNTQMSTNVNIDYNTLYNQNNNNFNADYNSLQGQNNIQSTETSENINSNNDGYTNIPNVEETIIETPLENIFVCKLFIFNKLSIVVEN